MKGYDFPEVSQSFVYCPHCQRQFHSPFHANPILRPGLFQVSPVDCLLCSAGFFINRCAHCGDSFSSKRGDAITCSIRCRTARHRRIHKETV